MRLILGKPKFISLSHIICLFACWWDPLFLNLYILVLSWNWKVVHSDTCISDIGRNIQYTQYTEQWSTYSQQPLIIQANHLRRKRHCPAMDTYSMWINIRPTTLYVLKLTRYWFSLNAFTSISQKLNINVNISYSYILTNICAFVFPHPAPPL